MNGCRIAACLTALAILTPVADAGLVWTGDVADDTVGGVSTANARDAATLLDDPWRLTVQNQLLGQGFTASEITFETPDILNPTSNLLSGGTGLTGTSSAFSNGVSFTYTQVDTKVGDTDTGTPDNSLTQAWSSRVGFLQEQSPVPTDLVNFTGVSEEAGDTPGLPLNGTLLEFSSDVENFGLFIGDVESRSLGLLAEIRLFDAADNLILQQSLQYSGTILTDGAGGSTTYDEADTAPASNNLNRWGDDQTAFVGFAGISNVRKLLLVVGDDDIGGTGSGNNLSFIGASIGFAVSAVPEPSAMMLLLLGAVLTVPRRSPRD